MADNYTILAPIYDDVGLADYTRQIVPKMLDYAQRNDWLGRYIADIGCGTGTGAIWLAESGFIVKGIDNSENMLRTAQERLNADMGLSVSWEMGDIRNINGQLGQMELIFAVDVMNEMETIKEIQSVFSGVIQSLKPEKLFIFDMYTIEGLCKKGTAGDEVLHEDKDLIMFARNSYDYEKQMAIQNHVTFKRVEANSWTRLDTARVLRSFPLQAIAALLQRAGFSNVTILDESFSPFDIRQGNINRVIFVATK